jgi:hypothetical protein
VTDSILSNLRAGNANLAEVQDDIQQALNSPPDDIERLANNVEDHLRCAQAHYAQAMSDMKAAKEAK